MHIKEGHGGVMLESFCGRTKHLRGKGRKNSLAWYD